jgi:sugar phosphate isomerase/epimerase
MRLAFPAIALPELDLPGVVRLAVENGMGIELHASRSAHVAVATNLLFTDAGKVRSLLLAAAVPLAAVWMTVPVAAPAVVAGELGRAVDAAANAGCPLVRLVESRLTPAAVLHDLGDAAARAGVRLTIENQPFRNGVADLWRRLDAVDHPAVGCCLDTLRAALGGDGPSVAVPVLGRQIAHVRLRHPSTDAETVYRLAGIGYDGWLSIDVDSATTVRGWLPKRSQV